MSEIRTRSVSGQFNQMAICSHCDRDASQTRMTRYCIHAVDHTPMLCDECYGLATRVDDFDKLTADLTDAERTTVILAMMKMNDLEGLPFREREQRLKQWDRNPRCPDCGSSQHFECP